MVTDKTVIRSLPCVSPGEWFFPLPSGMRASVTEPPPPYGGNFFPFCRLCHPFRWSAPSPSSTALVRICAPQPVLVEGVRCVSASVLRRKYCSTRCLITGVLQLEYLSISCGVPFQPFTFLFMVLAPPFPLYGFYPLPSLCLGSCLFFPFSADQRELSVWLGSAGDSARRARELGEEVAPTQYGHAEPRTSCKHVPAFQDVKPHAAQGGVAHLRMGGRWGTESCRGIVLVRGHCACAGRMRGCGWLGIGRGQKRE